MKWKLVLFFCLLFAGCTHPTIHPIPVVGTEESSDPVIHEAQAWSDSLYSLRLLGKLVVDSEDGRFTTRLAVVCRGPELLRVELLPLNSTVSLGLLLSKKGSATYIDFQGQRAIKGSLESLLGYSLLAVSANEPELLSLLSGRIFRGAVPERNVRVYHDKIAGAYQLVSGRGIWVIDERTKYLQKAQLFNGEGGDVRLDVRYVEDISGRTALMTVAGRNETLEFSVEREKVDTDVSDSLFAVNIPDYYTVY